MIRRPPRSTQSRSSAASDVYKRQDGTREAVVEHPLHEVGVLALAGREQQPPGPLEARYRRARLVVGAIGRQLMGIAERLAEVPRPVAAGDGGLGRDHVRPARDGRGEERRVAGLDRDVDDAGLQVEGPHGMAGDAGQLPDGQVILQIARAETRVARETVPALFDELAGQPEVLRAARLAVQLDEGGLDEGVTVESCALAREHADQVIGEPPGYLEQPGRPRSPRVRDPRLDEMARAVELVAGRQP